MQDFCNFQQENYLGFNFSDSVKWDVGKQEILTESGSYEKTVFVVNVNHLLSFIEGIKQL